jgi:hypothetical protein
MLKKLFKTTKTTLVEHLGLLHELSKAKKDHKTLQEIFFLQFEPTRDGHYNYLTFSHKI